MQVETAGIPGSADLSAEKWQNTQFSLSVFTCTGWGKWIGCSGERLGDLIDAAGCAPWAGKSLSDYRIHESDAHPNALVNEATS